MSLRNLSWWLNRLEQMQPDRIELGLDRITRVADKCGCLTPDFNVITVAGTNGKGSTVAYVASILSNSGLRVGIYTSPHFVDFNERIVVGDRRASGDLLCHAFELIDERRGDIDLTYFEFTTLAAMIVFGQANVDVAVLEVGLGGRLDAVNAWDSDVACVTSIGIDHSDWLGDDRESIGREKAGVARQGRALICGDPKPPLSISESAAEIGARLLQFGRDFSYCVEQGCWHYHGPAGEITLPSPQIKADWAMGNASVAITACAEFFKKMPDARAVTAALQSVSVPGRMQYANYRSVPLLLDVAHNPQAARALGQYLRAAPCHTIAVFSCLQDKDAEGVIAELIDTVDHWLVVQLDSLRAIEAPALVEMIGRHTDTRSEVFTSVIQAVDAAVAQSREESRIVIFGSFHVVGPVLELLGSQD